VNVAGDGAGDLHLNPYGGNVTIGTVTAATNSLLTVNAGITVNTEGIEIVSDLPTVITNRLYLYSGLLTWNGASVRTGTTPISRGGTGQTSAASAFSALAEYGADGDMLFMDGSTPARLAIGTNNYMLGVVSGAPTWMTPDTVMINLAKYLAGGDITYLKSSTGLPAALPIGATGRFLESNGSDPQWATITAGDITSNATTFVPSSTSSGTPTIFQPAGGDEILLLKPTSASGTYFTIGETNANQGDRLVIMLESKGSGYPTIEERDQVKLTGANPFTFNTGLYLDRLILVYAGGLWREVNRDTN